jgi:CheY-like chemotaxis protein
LQIFQEKEGDMAPKEPKILIVDDNQDFLFAMETLLKRNGFQTLTADNGEKGFDLAQKEQPDLILLDVMMETLYSGFEVCRRLKLDPQLRKIPIIGISGMADEIGIHFDKQRDEEYFSPDEFFEKPVDKVKLLDRIKELVKR